MHGVRGALGALGARGAPWGGRQQRMSSALLMAVLACVVAGAHAWTSSLVPMHATLCQPSASPRYGRYMLAHDVPYGLGHGVDSEAFVRGELVATHPRAAAVPCVRMHALNARNGTGKDEDTWEVCESDMGHALHGADALRHMVARHVATEGAHATTPVIMRMRNLGAMHPHHSRSVLGFSSITDMLSSATREARIPQLWPLLQTTPPTHVRFRVVAFVLLPRFNATMAANHVDATSTSSSSLAHIHSAELGERLWLEYNISLPQQPDEPLVPISDAVAVSNAVHRVLTGRIPADDFANAYPTAEVAACVADEPRLHVDDRSTCALAHATRHDSVAALAAHVHAAQMRNVSAHDLAVLAVRVQDEHGELRYAMNACTIARLPPASLLLGLVQVSLALVLGLAIASFVFCLATLGSVLTMSGAPLPSWLRITTIPVTFHLSLLSVRWSPAPHAHHE